MPLPNADRAVVDTRKLIEYCLNPLHPRGRHKARVFKAAVGFTGFSAPELHNMLLEIVRTEPATAGDADEFGERYWIDFALTGPKGTARARSVWIIKRDEDFPRLVSCYILHTS